MRRVHRASKRSRLLKLRNFLSNVSRDELWCKFRVLAIFSRVAWICQKIQKIFFSVAETIKMNWAAWRSVDCLEKQLIAFQVTLGRNLVVWPRYSWMKSIFFQLSLPFAVIYYDSHHLKKCLKCVSAFYLSVSWVPMWPQGYAKNLSIEFPEINIRENRAFWEDFCFRSRCYFLSTQLSTFGTSLLWNCTCQTATVFDFWEDEIFFSAKLSLKIVYLPWTSAVTSWLFSA